MVIGRTGQRRWWAEVDLRGFSVCGCRLPNLKPAWTDFVGFLDSFIWGWSEIRVQYEGLRRYWMLHKYAVLMIMDNKHSCAQGVITTTVNTVDLYTELQLYFK